MPAAGDECAGGAARERARARRRAARRPTWSRRASPSCSTATRRPTTASTRSSPSAATRLAALGRRDRPCRRPSGRRRPAPALSPSPASALPVRPPRVLDACAGTGLLALELARRGATVTAADAAPGMLAVARDRLAAAGLPLRTVAADLADEAAADCARRSVRGDHAWASGCATSPIPARCCGCCGGLLAPGGRLVVLEAVRPAARPAGGRGRPLLLSRWRRDWARRLPVAPSSTSAHRLDARARRGRRRGRAPARRRLCRRRAATLRLRRRRGVRRPAGLTVARALRGGAAAPGVPRRPRPVSTAAACRGARPGTGPRRAPRRARTGARARGVRR